MHDKEYWEGRAFVLVSEWQQRLRLLDWCVSWEIVGAGVIGDSEKFGEVAYDINSRTARISLLDPNDYADDDRPEGDCILEDTIIHELLHTLLAPVCGIGEDESEHQILLEEWAIRSVAGALMDVKYAQGTDPGSEK